MKCEEFRTKAKYKITIQQPAMVQDEIGGFSDGWTTLATVFAAIENNGGREAFSQEVMQSFTTHKMTIRYRPTLKATRTVGAYRVLYDGRTFAVKYVQNVTNDMKIEGRDFQILHVEENAADA